MDNSYLLDGDTTPVPDPRSRRLPAGVHEQTRTYDPSAYAWQDSGWRGQDLQGAAIYELHVGTFTPEGTQDAAAEKLGYLVDLGIDFIELLPVNGSTGRTTGATTASSSTRCTKATAGPVHTSGSSTAAHAAGLVAASPINPSDLIPVTGDYRSRTALPFIAGFEGVGVVEASETDDSRIRLGQRVIPIGSAGCWQTSMGLPKRWAMIADSICFIAGLR